MQLIIGIIVIMVFGVVTGTIAERKGGSFLPWFIFGALLFIAALPLALLMEKGADKTNCMYCRKVISLGQSCPECGRAQPGQIGKRSTANWQQVTQSEDEVAKWAKKNENESSG